MKFKLVGFVFCALSMFNVPVKAVTVNITYTGTVTSGFDSSGLFGTPADLTGKAFEADYTFNTSLGFSRHDAIVNQIDGGIAAGGPTPNLSAALIIAGHTVNVGGDWFANLIAAVSGTHIVQAPQVSSSDGNSLNNQVSTVSGVPFSIESNFSHTLDADAGETGYGQARLAGAFIELNTLTVAEVVTPLPAALPLFATGLGALGLLGWRRKRKAAALAA
jgi:hypothetical protein